MTSDTNRDIAELGYQLIKVGVLRTTLTAARMGALDIDWRTVLIARTSEPVPDLDEHCRTMLARAAAEVADLLDQAWEPEMRVGWRASLEAWYEATKMCTQDFEDIQRRIAREAGQSAHDVEAAARMDRDMDCASYRAGLTAAGLVSDWYSWLQSRISEWPQGVHREIRLEALSDPQYRRLMERLPRYWL
jgi:hypothetical protein